MESEQKSSLASSSLLFAGCFSALVSAATTALIIVARSGLELQPRLIALCAGVFLAAAFSPYLLPRTWRERLDRTGFALFLLPLLVLLSPLLALIAGPKMTYLYFALGAAGLVRAAPHILRMGMARLVFIIAAAPALAVYVFLSVESRGLAHVYLPECALFGLVELDAYFHTAICHMIQNFGVVSTGVDGLTPISYHVLSHFWFAALGTMARTTPVFSYPYGLMIILIPALFMGAISTVLHFSPLDRNRELIGTSLLLASIAGLDRIAANSHYISESQTMALGALLFSLPLLRHLLRPSPYRTRSDWAQFALVLLLCAIISLVKLSAGGIVGLALFFSLLRSNGASRKTAFGLLILFLAGATILVFFRPWLSQLYAHHYNAQSLSGPFLLYYRSLRVIAVATFAAPAIFLVAELRIQKVTNARKLLQAAKNKQTLNLELILTAVAAAFLVSLILATSDAWFFANTVQWLSLPFLISTFSGRTGKGNPRPVNFNAAFWFFILVLLLSWKQAARPCEVEKATPLSWNLHNIRMFLSHYPRRLEMPYCGRFTTEQLRSESTRTKDGPAFQAAVSPYREKFPEGLALFVPPENLGFWHLIIRPYSAAFYAPSVLGVPMLKGISPELPSESSHRKSYGYTYLGPEAVSAPSTKEQLCAHAALRGISRVLVLTGPGPGEDSLLQCR